MQALIACRNISRASSRSLSSLSALKSRSSNNQQRVILSTSSRLISYSRANLSKAEEEPKNESKPEEIEQNEEDEQETGIITEEEYRAYVSEEWGVPVPKFAQERLEINKGNLADFEESDDFNDFEYQEVQRRERGDYANSNLQKVLEPHMDAQGIPKFSHESLDKLEQLMEFYNIQGESSNEISPKVFLEYIKKQDIYDLEFQEYLESIDPELLDLMLSPTTSNDDSALLQHMAESPQILAILKGGELSPKDQVKAILTKSVRLLNQRPHLEISDLYQYLSSVLESPVEVAKLLKNEDLINAIAEDESHIEQLAKLNESEQEYIQDYDPSVVTTENLLRTIKYAQEINEVEYLNECLSEFDSTLTTKIQDLTNQSDAVQAELEAYLNDKDSKIIKIINSPKSVEFESLQDLLSSFIYDLETSANELLKNLVAYKMANLNDASKNGNVVKVLNMIDPKFSSMLSEYSDKVTAFKNQLQEEEKFKPIDDDLIAQELDTSDADHQGPTKEERLAEFEAESFKPLENYIFNQANDRVYTAFSDNTTIGNELIFRLITEDHGMAIPEAPESEDAKIAQKIDSSKSEDLMALSSAEAIKAKFFQDEDSKFAAELEKLRELSSKETGALDPAVAEANKAYDTVIAELDNYQKALLDGSFTPSAGPSSALASEEANDEINTDPYKSELQKQLKTLQDSLKDSNGNTVTYSVPADLHSEDNKSFKVMTKDNENLQLCVNLIMRKGKKETAKRYVNRVLYLIYLEKRKDPVKIFLGALDSLAPLVTTKTTVISQRRTTTPALLTEKQRIRMAMTWILDASDKRASNDFTVRLAEEILSVYSGTSSLIEKRNAEHKAAIVNRSYMRVSRTLRPFADEAAN